MPIESGPEIAELLKATRIIAMVGASDRPERASYGVMHFLQRKGYRVIPVNPQLAGQKIHGETVLATLAEIEDRIDMVDIFRNTNAAAAVIDDAIAVGAKSVWTQLGVLPFEAAARAEQAGLTVVMDRCPAIEMPRLGL